MKLFNLFRKHKTFVNGLLFIIVALLAGYTLFYGNNISNLIESMSNVSLSWLLLCAAAALLFIGVESIILWLLLEHKNKKQSLVQCLKYAFVGYFYSGITPSATGGQPFQLYYMTKDGNSTVKSTVSLLAMALFYKLIMVIMGIALLLFWSKGIIEFLDVYVWVYYLGMVLNVLVLLVILALMLIPEKTKSIIHVSVKLLIKLKILHESNERYEKINSFIAGYKASLAFLFQNKLKMGLITLLTFIQRSSLLFIPVFLYIGLNLESTSIITILCIQAAIYVAVDTLPIPGDQGITELILISALGSIFTERYLTISILITRSMSFYLLMLIGMLVVLFNSRFLGKKQNGSLLHEQI